MTTGDESTANGGLGRVIDAVTTHSALARPGQLVGRLGRGTLRRVATRAQDVIGHPLHPAMTDLPIGFWTSAWVLDLLPGRAKTAVAARRLLGLGVASTVPAVLSGLGDAAGMGAAARRTAAVHGLLNAGATAAFAWSWWLRRGTTTSKARWAGHLGAVLATGAGTLGGHLAFNAPDDPDPVASPG